MPTKARLVPTTRKSCRHRARRGPDAARSVPAKANQARSKPAFQRFARLGLCAGAVIYVLLAYMAADIALTRNSPAQPSGSGALTEIGKQPGGGRCWACSPSAWPATGHGVPPRRWGSGASDQKVTSAVKRVGWAGVAVIYFGLCARAVTLALGTSSTGSSVGVRRPTPSP